MITVRAFAGARDLMGHARLQIEPPSGGTAGDVWQALCERFPELADFRLQGLAVNREYVGFDHPVSDGDEVAVIPPVSGG